LAAVLFLLLLVALVPSDSVASRRPRQAGPDTPWEDLRSVLSSPEVLHIPTVIEWKEQCLDPMIFDQYPMPEPFHLFGYDIGYAPAGVCMVHMSCMYPGCKYMFAGPESCPADTPNCIRYNSVLEPPFDSSDLFDDEMELPAAVLHPKTASDVVRGVEFAKEHGIGISVKVMGHSYFGSSTARGTLLIKMSTNYASYGIDGSLTECGVGVHEVGTADGMACDLAEARGKKAYLRVGGGELFDTAYRAVFFDWNENAANQNKYHFVGGYCGTVSAAGGWMHSGGLSGASMRLHGIGIDQVLHVEMVLPGGQHVRFGPTKWKEEREGYIYPETTEVTGYCNANVHDDESLWEWTQCEDDIGFADLWYAVRGGGGGTFGLVTSLYYQLHDLPGTLQVVRALDPELTTREDTTKTITLLHDYLKFSLTFLYLPERLHNVSQFESRSCNSPAAFLSVPAGGELYCHNSAGDKFIEEWKMYIKEDGETGKEYGEDAELLAQAEDLFTINREFPSQGFVTLRKEEPHMGRLQDDFGVKLSADVRKGFDHVPLYTVTNYLDELVEMLINEAFAGAISSFYLMGGAVPESTDRMNSLSPLRRDAALARTTLTSPELYKAFYDLVWRDANLTTSDSDFPGIFCHNHASNENMGPLKEDWSQPCPSLLEMSQEEREEKCVSQAESFWGTANVARLEEIKKTIDPDELFICNAGIGASSPFVGGVEGPADDENDDKDDGTGSPASSSFCSKAFVVIAFVLATSLVL